MKRKPENRTREGLGLGPRPRTENLRVFATKKVRLAVLQDDATDLERPRTRGECEGGERPCPFVGCRYNLYLEVDEANGSIRYTFPDREPDEVDPDRSCALDIADRGGGTLEDVGALANVTRERIRQVEAKAIKQLQRRSRYANEAGVLREYCDVPNEGAVRKHETSSRSVFKSWPVSESDASDDNEDDAPPTRISFFSPEADRNDELVCRSVWTMFARSSNGHGFKVAKDGAMTRSFNREAEDTEMPKKKRGELQLVVLSAYRALERDLGRAPTAGEVFERLGVEEASSVSNVQGTIATLRRRGELGPSTNRPESSTPSQRAKTQPEPTPRVASSDRTVSDLIAKRDELRRKADALDGAIEALSVAL